MTASECALNCVKQGSTPYQFLNYSSSSSSRPSSSSSHSSSSRSSSSSMSSSSSTAISKKSFHVMSTCVLLVLSTRYVRVTRLPPPSLTPSWGECCTLSTNQGWPTTPSSPSMATTVRQLFFLSHSTFPLSHIDIPLSTQEMFNILENRMKTDLNLSNSSYLKGPRHLVSLIYRLRVNAFKTKYCARKNYQPITLFLLFDTNYKYFFRNSKLFPNSTINTFPTEVLYNPQYLIPLAHLLLKSPVDPLLLIVYMSVYLCYAC